MFLSYLTISHSNLVNATTMLALSLIPLERWSEHSAWVRVAQRAKGEKQIHSVDPISRNVTMDSQGQSLHEKIFDQSKKLIEDIRA